MPAPAFTWKDYEVPADPSGEGLELMAAADAAAPAMVKISLPDLHAYPTPLEKAAILLQSAAEVEHALMVQYLYAAYSLKIPKEVSEQAQKVVLRDAPATAWPPALLSIAREEMGHLMTVQNLLLLLGMAPNFDREDFPPQKDLYPFKLHLEPVSQRSLAKYVVAEAATGAPGIEDIVALATDSAGASINRVGTLYGLLGLVFAARDQVAPGASGDEAWDTMVRQLAVAAYDDAPPEAWHLPDDAFHPQSLVQQADPGDWQTAHVRVHRVADRAAAVQAIRDVGEQGEGPTGQDEQSHFARFLAIFRGQDGLVAFPAAGEWVPTRDVPTDPQVQDIGDPRTRRWAELADLRYALLLGFVEHYLLAPAEQRARLVTWIFPEMRSRLGFVARELTEMPRAGAAGAPGSAAAASFTLPADLSLPADEAARWQVHRARTEAAISKVEEMLAAGGETAIRTTYLTDLHAADVARLALLPASPTITTSFARDIQPLFSPKDTEHMLRHGVVLNTYEGVTGKEVVDEILRRMRSADLSEVMPPPPDPAWTEPQLELFERWMREGFQR